MTTQELKECIDQINKFVISKRNKFNNYQWETLTQKYDRFHHELEYLFRVTDEVDSKTTEELKKLNSLLTKYPELAISELASRYVWNGSDTNIVGSLALIFIENNLQLENKIVLRELYKILERGGYGYQPNDVLKLIEKIAIKNTKAFVESIVALDIKNPIKTRDTDWLLQKIIGIYSFKGFDPKESEAAYEKIKELLQSIIDRRLDETTYTFAIQSAVRLGTAEQVFKRIVPDILNESTLFDIWYLNIFLKDNFDATLTLYDDLLTNHRNYSSKTLLASLTALWFSDDNTKNFKIAELIERHLKIGTFNHSEETTEAIAQHMERCIPNSRMFSEDKYVELVRNNLRIWGKYSDCLLIMYSWNERYLYQSLAASLKFWCIESIEPNLKMKFVKDFIEKVKPENARLFLIDFFLDFVTLNNVDLLKYVIERGLVNDAARDQYQNKLNQLQADNG